MQLTPLDLKRFFHPESIAIVGVSRSGWRFGGLSFMRKYIEAGFSGRIYPVNAKADEILGVKAWPDIASLPETPDLVMIAVAAARVPGLIEECAKKGSRHVHLLTAGFDELGTPEGKEMAEKLVSVCRENGVRLIGPNCMGPYCPAAGLTAWGAIPGLTGPLGIISQSGGMTQRLTEYTASLGLGVRKAVSVGNGSVLDALDFLEAFGGDQEIRVIGIYLEGVSDGERFLSLAGEIGHEKPIVVLKGGETAAGARTAASHTGAMAGSAAIWKAVLRQANMIRVNSMDGWADALLALSMVAPPASRNVFALTGGGGTSVLYGDNFIREGLSIPELGAQTMERLKEIVPVAGSIAGNPLDLWLVFNDVECLKSLLDLAETDPAVAAVVIDRLIARSAFHSPEMPDLTRDIVEMLEERKGEKPVIFVVDTEGGDPDLASQGAASRRALGRAGYAAFPTSRRAARALSRLCTYYEGQVCS